MSRYIVRRVAQASVVLLGVSVIVFMLVHLVPGDPIRTSLGTQFDPAIYEALREQAGLDKPLPVQYASWLGKAVTGDLGVSFRTGEPVAATLLERLLPTFSLALAGLVIALVIALPLGMLAAVRAGSRIDRVVTVISQVGVSVPDFLLAILGILLFALVLGWLPSSGYVSPLNDPLSWLRHVALPATAIGVISGSIITRFVRSAVLEALGQNHTRTARSKGLPEPVVLRRHVLRNALVPIVTIIGLQLAVLFGGVIIVEVVFSWPGLGLLSLQAVQQRDYPVLQGTVLLLAVIFLIVNLLVDLLYAALDPRIRYT